VTPIAQRTGAGGLDAPADHAVGQGVQEQVAQLAAIDLRAPARAVVGLLQDDVGVVVQQPHRLPALMNDLAERLVQVGGVQRDLPVLLVDVEHAALGSDVSAGLQVEHRGLDAASVQDTRQGQAAEAGADDRDGVMCSGHDGVPCWMCG
jgi:hypothetical protein